MSEVTHVLQTEQVWVKMSWHGAVVKMFSFYVRWLLSFPLWSGSHDILPWLWVSTSLHPPYVRWLITLLSLPPPPPGRGNLAAYLCWKQVAQKDEKGKKKMSMGKINCPMEKGKEIFCLHKGTPGRDWIMTQVIFSSLLCSQGAAALGWAALKQGASFLHQEVSRRQPTCTAKPRKQCCGGWISMLTSNYKAQEQLSARNFWFCFLFLSSCSQSFASEKCYKQPWPSWKKQYAVSLTSTSLFRSLSALWLMVLFINVGRLSAFPE